MKKLLLILTALLSNQISAQIQSINIEEGFVTYKTAREGEIEVDLFFHKDTNSSDLDEAVLKQLLDYTNLAISSTLKSRRSYVPLNYTYKFKPNKKGKKKKDEHSMSLNYEARYGIAWGAIGVALEDFAQIEFNAKLKETMGSVMLRTN